jgi:SNF2 family DNA or RNA helicase
MLASLLRTGNIRKAVVVTKADLTENWRSEFAVHAPHLVVRDLHGKKPEERTFGTADVFLLNYELFSRKGNGTQIPNAYVSGKVRLSGDAENAYKLLQRCKCAMVLDESHRIKNPDSQTTRTLCW